jgi:hypothetical protein
VGGGACSDENLLVSRVLEKLKAKYGIGGNAAQADD